jgi:hypothetical protein
MGTIQSLRSGDGDGRDSAVDQGAPRRYRYIGKVHKQGDQKSGRTIVQTGPGALDHDGVRFLKPDRASPAGWDWYRHPIGPGPPGPVTSMMKMMK